MTSTTPLLTPKLAEFIRSVLAQPTAIGLKVQISEARHLHDHLHRLANRASALELVKLYSDSGAPTLSFGTYITVTDLGVAELKRYDQGTLPLGVRVLTDGTVTGPSGGGKIGRLRRSGAMTAAAVTWSAYGFGDESVHLGDFRGDRTAAVRAICKNAGLALPGE